jgi:hypothetical protein
MKLQLKKAEIIFAPNWHPDFRNAGALPDLKVVRTSFFLNAVCITLTAAALLLTAYREYTAYSIRTEIRQSEHRMEAIKGQNAKLLEMSKEFVDGSRKFAEIEKFSASALVASELLVALSRTMPSAVDFSSVVFDSEQLVLHGAIRGASETASTRLTAYLEVLRQDPVLGARFPEVSLTNMSRDAGSTGLSSFDITMKPAPAKPESKPRPKP